MKQNYIQTVIKTLHDMTTEMTSNGNGYVSWFVLWIMKKNGEMWFVLSCKQCACDPHNLKIDLTCWLQPDFVLHYNIAYRWRTSFLWSLIFGLPSVAVMMYFMFAKPPADEHSSFTNSSSENVTTTYKPHVSSSDHYQIMVYPGLSLENLIMFILATPVQVSVSLCNFYLLFIDQRSLAAHRFSVQ